MPGLHLLTSGLSQDDRYGPTILRENEFMNYQFMQSPIGQLRLVSDGEKLVAIEFEGRHQVTDACSEEADEVLCACANQLNEYFGGERKAFELPLAPRGTSFQHSVWKALENIPYGTLASYADIARDIDRPTAVRAVGAANGRNPLPIVVPCHRVVGSDGSLTGFAGGIETKRRLLELEGALPTGSPL